MVWCPQFHAICLYSKIWTAVISCDQKLAIAIDNNQVNATTQDIQLILLTSPAQLDVHKALVND